MQRLDNRTIKKPDKSTFPQLLGKLLILALALLSVSCASTTGAASKITPTPPQVSPTGRSIEQAVAPGSVEVKITLVEFRIISSVTVFRAGIPYHFVIANHHFVIANRGHDIHEFMIMPDKPDGTPLPPDAQYKSMLMELEPILPGTTWSVNYTFIPAATSRYEFACQMGRHYQAGMRLPIVVTS